MKNLEGLNVFVTGGGRGIGAGIVRVLAERGARVAFTYTSRPEAAEEVLKTLPGEGHFVVKMDVSHAESVQTGLAQVFERMEHVDGLVNNAGITKDQLILRMKDEDFDSVIATNLKGTFLCSRAVVKAMVKARRGSIVNISSVIGSMGNPGQTNYAASKSGIEGFTRSLAQEVASRGIRVNSVAPGFIATEMSDAIDPKHKEVIMGRIPMARLGEAQDVAQAVAFLLSSDSAYITGQTLHVNGGLYM